MKIRFKSITPAALSAALLFTGCAAKPISSVSAADSVSKTVVSNETKSQADQSTETESTDYSAETIDTGEIFSKRDLSGEYDLQEAVSVQLRGTDVSCSQDGADYSGSALTITKAGTYILSGTLDNGSIIIDVSSEDKVQLVLNGVDITSETFAAIYVRQADKVFLTLADGTKNTLTNGGTFTQIDENDVDAAVFAKDDLTLNGGGTLRISSPAGSGISGKDDVTITDGVYEIEAEKSAVRARDTLAVADGTFTLNSQNDGLHAENSDDETLGNIYIAGGKFNIQVSDDAIHANTLLRIDGGSFSITSAEGLEGTYIMINDGTILINASDDGVNAAYKSSAYTPTFEMNGGTLTIQMGAGDTDGLDSNSDIIINGGTVDITAQSPFDYDGTAQYNGGTLTVNGESVNSITNQMMGGGMRRGMGGMKGGMGGVRSGGMRTENI